MTGFRLIAVGVVAVLIVVTIVIGSAFDVLRASFKRLRDQQKQQLPPPSVGGGPRTAARPGRNRYAPERTRRRWVAPEILAVLLLALAAGLWLSKLVG